MVWRRVGNRGGILFLEEPMVKVGDVRREVSRGRLALVLGAVE